MRSLHEGRHVEQVSNGTDRSQCRVLWTLAPGDSRAGLGDDDTANDIQVDMANGTITVVLRAERSGKDSGRIYTITITITATDGAGNSSMTSLRVVVPRNQGQGGT